MGSIAGGTRIGGIAGMTAGTAASPVNITDSFFNGTVSATGSFLSHTSAGGIIGTAGMTNVSRCFSMGSISAMGLTGTPTFIVFVSGIIAQIWGGRSTAVDCFSSASITAHGRDNGEVIAYGIASHSGGGSNAINSYFSGTILATRSAGVGTSAQSLVGGIGGTAVNNSVCIAPSLRAISSPNGNMVSYITPNTPSQGGASGTNNRHMVLTGENIAGTMQNPPAQQNSTVITPAQRFQKETYTAIGWDFDKVWDINPAINGGLPFLRGVGFNQRESELERIIKELEGRIKELKDEITDLKSTHATDISALNQTLTSMSETIETLTTQLGTSNANLENALAEIQTHLATIELRNQTITGLETANGFLQSQLTTAEGLRDTYYDNWQNELTNVNNLFNLLATAIDDLDNKDAQIIELQGQVDDLIGKLATEEGRRITYYGNWQTELSRANNLQTQLTQAEADRDEYFTDWQTAINVTIPALQLALATATGDTTALQSQLAQAETDRDNFFAEWQTAINITIPDLRAELLDAQTERNKYYTYWQTTLILISGYQTQLTDAFETIEGKEDDIDILLGQLADIKGERDNLWTDLQTALGTINNLNKTIIDLNNAIDTMTDLNASDLLRIQTIIITLQAEIDALNEAIKNNEQQQSGPPQSPNIFDSFGFWLVVVGVILVIISAIILAVHFNRHHKLYIRTEKVNKNG
jgi:uncharacterized coiled-coil DUF342 family protein